MHTDVHVCFGSGKSKVKVDFDIPPCHQAKYEDQICSYPAAYYSIFYSGLRAILGLGACAVHIIELRGKMEIPDILESGKRHTFSVTLDH